MARVGELEIDDIIYLLKILSETVESIETDNDVYDMIKSLEKFNR